MRFGKPFFGGFLSFWFLLGSFSFPCCCFFFGVHLLIITLGFQDRIRDE